MMSPVLRGDWRLTRALADRHVARRPPFVLRLTVIGRGAGRPRTRSGTRQPKRVWHVHCRVRPDAANTDSAFPFVTRASRPLPQ